MTINRHRALPLLVAMIAALAAVPVAAATSTPVVVDAEGQPVEDAHVQVLDRPATDSPVAALTHRLIDGRTDAAGRFPAPVPDLDHLLLLVDHPDHSPLVLADGGATAQLKLGPGEELIGTVRLPDAAEETERPTTGPTTGPTAGPTAAPLSAGEVCARWTTPFAAWHWQREWQRCAPLSEDGRFRLAGLPTATVTVEARVPGFLPARAEAAAGPAPQGATPRPDLILALERGTLITGQVTDLAGRPIADATLAAGDVDAITDAKGCFRLAVASLPVRLQVAAAGYRPAHRDLLPKTPAEGLTLSLAPGQQVAGVLLGPAGPLDAGELWAERRDGPQRQVASRVAFETTDGAFRVDLPEAGLYQLALSAPGYRIARLPATELAAGEVRELGAVALQSGGVVLGRLVDPASGEGLPAAALRVLPLGNAILDALRRNAIATATSADDGTFRVSGLEAGEYELRIGLRGHAAWVREVSVGHDEQVDLGDVELGTGVEVFGRVTDRRGDGRGGVRVELSSPSGQGVEPVATAFTGPDGRFDGISLQPGGYRVRVLGDRPLLSQEIEIPAGDERYEADLVISSVRVSGRILRGEEPVAGGEVALSSDLDPGWRRGAVLVSTGGQLQAGRLERGLPSTLLRSQVDSQGSFVVADAPPGPVTATYVDTDGKQHVERLQLPDEAEARVTLRLDGGDVAGRATDADTGAGLAAQVRLFDLAGRTVGSAYSAVDGSFRFDDLEVQRYRLEVAADGYRTATVDPVVPNGDAVRVALEPGDGGGLAVRLARSDGSPAARIQVTLLSAAGNLVRSLLTDALGRRDFDDLPAGSYFVVWSDPVTGTGSTAPVEVANQETVRVEERLGPGSPLLLACDPDACAGRALAGIGLFTADGVDVSSYLPRLDPVLRFSAAGDLGLGRLAPGRYLLRLWTSNGRSDRLITVRGGEPVVVSL